MVRKRAKRKATATSGPNNTGLVESSEKNSTRVLNNELTSVKKLSPDQEMPHNEFGLFLKRNVQPLSDNPASDKITMVFKRALML